ncbi:MAG: hypothetical protein LBT92_04290 [Rickettsiales bacterium]|jgi:uncharacterized membrane protein|nr:hypothetical protein [Rickettsiales bacterium]
MKKNAKNEQAEHKPGGRSRGHGVLVLLGIALLVFAGWGASLVIIEMKEQRDATIELRADLFKSKQANDDALNQAIEKALKDVRAEIKEDMAGLSARVDESIAGLKRGVVSRGEMDDALSRVKSLEDFNRSARGANLVALSATLILKERAMSGAPFADLAASVANPEIAKFAETGVKSPLALAREFDALAPEISVAAAGGPSNGFFRWLKSIIHVRRIDAAGDETSADGIIAKTAGFLASLDLAAAYAEFAKIKDVSAMAYAAGEKWHGELGDAATLGAEIDKMVGASLKIVKSFEKSGAEK